jgi:molecular chaperone DnaJ
MSSVEDKYYQGKSAYEVLDVQKGSNDKDIKRAYRKAIAKWHPDKFPDDEEAKTEANMRMQRINRAYYCIGEEDRRRRYDQYGEEGVGTSAASEEQLKAAGGPGMGGFGGMGGQQVDVGDISDIFDAFFGGQGGGGGGGFGGQQRRRQANPNAPQAGEDLQVEVEIPFMSVVKGSQEKVRVRRLEQCGTCTGSGVKPGAKISSCSTCGGQGVVNNVQRTPFGVFQNVQPCPNCRGSGQQVEEYCPTCRGKGNVADTKEVVIRVPPGVETGSQLLVRDAGNAGRKGGPRGNLYVQLRVKRDPRFRREGTEVYTEEEIPYYSAILGATVKAATVDGEVEVKVPPGTQPDQKLRLRGKGVPRMGSDTRGDQYITVKVKIPTDVSGEEKKLIEKIAEDGAPSGKKGWFGSK